MKRIIYIVTVLLIISCSKEDANDCLQNAGTTIQEDFPVGSFTKILVNRDIKLVIKQGAEHAVMVETGEYLMNDIKVEITDQQLQITNNNTCNFIRDYALTTVYVTAPNITDIRSSTQFSIISNGILNYPTLRLFSEDITGVGTITSANFRLQVNANNFRVVANNLSSFYISGNVENLFVGFYSGVGRFQGEDLIAQNVSVYHRGANDMVVNPQQSLSGELLGTGDLISVNRPPTVEVEQLYTGRLIFE